MAFRNHGGRIFHHKCKFDLGHNLHHMLQETPSLIMFSGGSRNSRRGVGRGPVRGGMDLRHGCFSAKMYVKMKELGPVGGGGRVPGMSPRSANDTPCGFSKYQP